MAEKRPKREWFYHRWPRNQWFLTLNKLILCILFPLKLSETRGIVFFSCDSRFVSRDVRVVLLV